MIFLDEIVGWIGTLCVLASYVIMHPAYADKVKHKDWAFQITTFFGSGGLSYICAVKGSWQPFVVNSIVFLSTIGAIVLLWLKRNKAEE